MVGRGIFRLGWSIFRWYVRFLETLSLIFQGSIFHWTMELWEEEYASIFSSKEKMQGEYITLILYLEEWDFMAQPQTLKRHTISTIPIMWSKRAIFRLFSWFPLQHGNHDCYQQGGQPKGKCPISPKTPGENNPGESPWNSIDLIPLEWRPLPGTNSEFAPEKWWLEGEFPFWGLRPIFRGFCC